MIKSITVTNRFGESLTLELRDPYKTGLAVLNVDGLGPCKADINTTKLASSNGSKFESARLNERNITISLGFLPNPTVEDSRLLSYKYFPVEENITLLIETDNRLALTSGYVESNEPSIFSNDEGTQISIICPDSYFYDPRETEVEFSVITPMFGFPFSNKSLTENLIEFGSINSDIRAVADYEGEASVGIILKIHAFDEVGTITIYNTETLESISIDTSKIESITGKAFGAGEDLIISTSRKNTKYARLLRNGSYINVLYAIGRDDDWFQLSKNRNIFTFTAGGNEENLLIKMVYSTAYKGV